VSEQFLNGTSAYIRSRHAALGLPLCHRVACVGSVHGLVRLVDYAVAYVAVAIAWLVACRMVLSLWSAVAQLTPCVATLHYVATVTVASLGITPLSSRVASRGSSRIGIPCCRDRYGRLSAGLRRCRYCRLPWVRPPKKTFSCTKTDTGLKSAVRC